MFNHFHPYKPFIFEDTNTLIIGTLPPPRFCKKDLKTKDVDFCYGSQDNLLWQVLNKIFKLNLLFDNSQEAVKMRKDFLILNNIGICDIVDSCKREKINASDLGMKDVVLRDLIFYLKKYKNINKIVFTGKSSKNGPEYFFKQLIKKHCLNIQTSNNKQIKEQILYFDNRSIKLFSLTSPSNAANRSIGANTFYKERKKTNPNYSTFDFRVDEYKLAFT